jgi:hypothetical protein
MSSILLNGALAVLGITPIRNVTVNKGSVDMTGNTTPAFMLDKVDALVPGGVYDVAYTINSISSGSVYLLAGGAATSLQSAPGTYNEQITMPNPLSGADSVQIRGTTGAVANLSGFSLSPAA